MNCIQFAQLISFLKCGLLEQLTTSNFSLILPKETTTLTLLTGIRTVSYPLNVKWIPLKVTVYCLIVFFLETVAEEAQKKKQQQQQKLSTCSPINADRKKNFKVSVCNKHHEQKYKDFKVQNYKKQNSSNNNNIINGLVSKKLTYLASINCIFYWKLRFLSFFIPRQVAVL